MLNIHNIYFIRFYHNFNLMYSEKRTMLKINTKKIVIDLKSNLKSITIPLINFYF